MLLSAKGRGGRRKGGGNPEGRKEYEKEKKGGGGRGCLLSASLFDGDIRRIKKLRKKNRTATERKKKGGRKGDIRRFGTVLYRVGGKKKNFEKLRVVGGREKGNRLPCLLRACLLGQKGKKGLLKVGAGTQGHKTREKEGKPLAAPSFPPLPTSSISNRMLIDGRTDKKGGKRKKGK